MVSGSTVDVLAGAVRLRRGWTSGGVLGLNMHTAEQVRITTQQGLPSNYTKSILLANNNLWIGTDNGLCCYNLFHKQIRTFATQPQLANVSFSVNAACQLPDGRLAFILSQQN